MRKVAQRLWAVGRKGHYLGSPLQGLKYEKESTVPERLGDGDEISWYRVGVHPCIDSLALLRTATGAFGTDNVNQGAKTSGCAIEINEGTIEGSANAAGKV